MATLHISAFGRLQVCRDQIPLHFATLKAQQLLCFLLLHGGKPLDREAIAEQFWPMQPPGRARRSLSTALWRLGQSLEVRESPCVSYLRCERNTLAFDVAAPHWFDVEEFEQRAAFGLADSPPCSDPHARALEEAVGLYRGDFLEGCYDDWCLSDRERLRLIFQRVLGRLQRHYRQCAAFDMAISTGYNLLALDPLQEDVHRELMRCYAEAGQRPLALEQFRHCREILQRELDTEPMPETKQLLRQIQGNYEADSPRRPRQDAGAALEAALSQFRGSIDSLEAAFQALRAAAIALANDSTTAQVGASRAGRGG